MKNEKDGVFKKSKQIISKSIKEIPNFYIPSNLFWNDISNQIININDFTVGVYDSKNPVETFKEFTEEDYNKVKEYIKKTETKVQRTQSVLSAAA